MIKKVIGVLLISVMSVTPLCAATVTKQFYNIGNKKVSIPSIVEGGKTYTELRSISTYTGLKIEYKDGVVIIQEPYAYRGHKIVLEIDTKNGKAISYDYYDSSAYTGESPVMKSSSLKEINGIKELNVAVKTSEGKTYLPLRVIADEMKLNLSYKNGTVVLTDGESTYITTDKEQEFIKWGLSEFANSGFHLTKWKITEGEFLAHPKVATDLSHNLIWYCAGFFGLGTDVDPELSVQLQKLKAKKNELISKKAEVEKSNGALSPTAERFYNYLLNTITGLIDQVSAVNSEGYRGTIVYVYSALFSYNNAVLLYNSVFRDYIYGCIEVLEVVKEANVNFYNK